MAMVDEIADVLEQQLEPEFGDVGCSVFTHHMPPAPDVAYSVHQFPMGPPVITMTKTIAEQLGLQIQCRAKTREQAERNCYAVFNLLQQTVNTELDSLRVNGIHLGKTFYFGILLKKSPSLLKIDSENRSVFYCEFSVTKAPSPQLNS